jgi:hypothetical protein
VPKRIYTNDTPDHAIVVAPPNCVTRQQRIAFCMAQPMDRGQRSKDLVAARNRRIHPQLGGGYDRA